LPGDIPKTAITQPYSGPYKVLEKNPKYFRLDIGGKSTAVTRAAHRQRGNDPGGTAQARTPAATAVHLAGHAGNVNGTHLTGDTSDVNSTDYTSPGSIARTSSHYRSSPSAAAQSS